MHIDNVEFIHIPRTGGTTMLTHLSELDPVRFNVDRDHCTALQLSAVDTTFHKKYSFAICRNPYQRLVSIWQYELKRALGSKDPDFAELNDFNVWLKRYASNLDWGRSFMVLPQWFWISDWWQKQLVTDVFHFEEYDYCLDKIGSRLGLEFNKTVIMNRSMKQQNYRDITTSESRRIMIELCSADCRFFGYVW